MTRSFRFFSALALLVLAACDGPAPDFFRPVEGEIARAKAPSGWCVAYACPTPPGPNRSTLVVLSYDQGWHGAVAAEFERVVFGLKLRWLDDATLEVERPDASVLPGPIGAATGVLNCSGREVRVVLTVAGTP